MQTDKKQINYPQKIARILLKSILFLVLFALLIFILMFTPPVQRYLTGRVENYLENKLQTRVEIGRVAFGLSGNVTLLDIYVEDRTRDTLLSGSKIRAHLNYIGLFSNEVEVKDLELQNITAKVKRLLPDTVFNFQFIVDAFVSEKRKDADTAAKAPLKLNVSDISLENVRLSYEDVITGSGMFARIGNLTATIDTLDPYQPHIDIPTIIARNVTARIKQYKPLVEPEPMSKDIVDAVTPSVARYSFGTIDLTKFSVLYENDVSAYYTSVNLGKLIVEGRLIDLQKNTVHLEQLVLNNSKTMIRLGKKEEARLVEKEVRQEVEAQKKAGWDFRVAHIEIENNSFDFDNDNHPSIGYGIDYSHMHGDDININLDNFILNEDSVAGKFNSASFAEKSGFVLEDLSGDILYAYNETYFRDLLIKTPGSLIRRNGMMEYASIEALENDFASTVIDVELVNSHVQVKDILAFAPQLRRHPAMSNPEDTWYLNIIGNGTLNRLNFETLEFDGLRNTQINARGTLTGLMNPVTAGGNFFINRLHTTQTDISLFTGSRLSTSDTNIPEEFDVTGTVSGNAGKLNTDLDISTSAGFLSVNGWLSNLTDTRNIRYNVSMGTSRLNLGSILKNPQLGRVSGSFVFNGKGLTASTLDTRFKAKISSFGFNNYQYRNLALQGVMKQSNLQVEADARDPNADFNITATGNFSSTSSFRVRGFVDSLKTLPLNLTTQPIIFHGKIDADVASLNADYLEADVWITNALVVSGNERLPIDSFHLVSGRTDTGQFMRINSDVANVLMEGQYRLADLPHIISNSIQPYFSVQPSRKIVPTRPYNFRFTADIIYAPILTTFIPGLEKMQTVRAAGSFESNAGMQAELTTPFIAFNGNELTNLNLVINTTPQGLVFSGTADQLKNKTFDLHRTRINATALNNVINFSAATDDINGTNKYFLSGVLNQPSQGTYAISLNPDSLLLNYEKWNVNPGNQIIIYPDRIAASNFILSKGQQRLTLNSLAGTGDTPLNVDFTNFQLATITGFINADTLIADGIINGQVSFTNLMKQPLFTGNVTINDLSLRQDTIGNVALQVHSTAGNRYIIRNATITGRGNDVSIKGKMAPRGTEVELDLDMNIRSLQLNTMEGALASVITNASGYVNGDVKVIGTLNNPDIHGELNFNKTSFTLTVLGSRFNIDNEKLMVTEDAFVFQGFSIRDSANNSLNLNGTISTSNFVNYRFNLYVNADNFLVLNSPKRPNSIYWGRLNISSELFIGGTEIRPVVDGAITINDGTNLSVVIPQREYGIQQREGIVEFVDMDAPGIDSLFLRYDSLNYTAALGLDISTNIEIKKEAIFNIIVDEANGDFLNVRGEALLSAGIDPSGKINLVGNYQLEEGAYELSFNFIRRRFEIEKGSSIVWTGLPTAAELNVRAVYVANTAPIDLVQDQISASTDAIKNTYMQKLPFEVWLSLTGELLKPIVDFDIVLPEEKNYGVSNDIVTQVQSRLTQMRLDEGEVNKQVFSLLLLNRFVGEDPFESSGGGFSAGTYARQSVSKLMTEQLNRLAGGLIQGVDINFDVVSSEDYTTGQKRNKTDLNIGLSKRLLNERLLVTVGSNFELQGQQSATQTNNNIAGDVSVAYQLSKDGRYMLRFFRRNEYVGVVDGYIIETGLGFSLNVDYDKFKEILKRRKQKVTKEGTQL